VLVDDGVEGETIAPRRGEVPHVHVVVAGRLHLAPEQQGILGGPGGSTGPRFFHGDLLDLEPQDDGPDETEGEPRISINDVVCAHVFQVHALLVQEGERLVDVLQAVNSHFTLGWARLQKRREVTLSIQELGHLYSLVEHASCSILLDQTKNPVLAG